jgi:protein involved in sex pheromone biosynthesis
VSSFTGGDNGRDEEQQQQDSVRGLFSSYGKIVKVHAYRNKRTGGLKGDALVVFQVSCKAEGGALVQMVCSQVSRRIHTLLS